MLTYEQILALPIAGNAHSDAHIFRAVDAFARNTAHPVEQRAGVIRHSAHNVMGLTGADAGDNLTDEELLIADLGE